MSYLYSLVTLMAMRVTVMTRIPVMTKGRVVFNVNADFLLLQAQR